MFSESIIEADEKSPYYQIVKDFSESLDDEFETALAFGGMMFKPYISKGKIYEIMSSDTYKEIHDIYLKPDDIYYIIFTSGSTGIPKGVKITYKNLNSCINWLKNITKIEKGVILNQANFSFDLSVADLYLSLISESEHFIINDILRIRF